MKTLLFLLLTSGSFLTARVFDQNFFGPKEGTKITGILVNYVYEEDVGETIANVQVGSRIYPAKIPAFCRETKFPTFGSYATIRYQRITDTWYLVLNTSTEKNFFTYQQLYRHEEEKSFFARPGIDHFGLLLPKNS